jgi:hypothetical protein
MSGYAEEEAAFAERIRHNSILAKPFGAGTLVSRIQQALTT